MSALIDWVTIVERDGDLAVIHYGDPPVQEGDKILVNIRQHDLVAGGTRIVIRAAAGCRVNARDLARHIAYAIEPKGVTHG